MNSIMEAREKKEIKYFSTSISHNQANRKERDKRFIKNWHPISPLNVDYKIVAKALATRLKETLSKLISFEQTAYMKNRFVGEVGMLISYLVEVSEILNLKTYIVTVDIEKAFNSF